MLQALLTKLLQLAIAGAALKSSSSLCSSSHHFAVLMKLQPRHASNGVKSFKGLCAWALMAALLAEVCLRARQDQRLIQLGKILAQIMIAVLVLALAKRHALNRLRQDTSSVKTFKLCCARVLMAVLFVEVCLRARQDQRPIRLSKIVVQLFVTVMAMLFARRHLTTCTSTIRLSVARVVKSLVDAPGRLPELHGIPVLSRRKLSRIICGVLLLEVASLFGSRSLFMRQVIVNRLAQSALPSLPIERFSWSQHDFGLLDEQIIKLDQKAMASVQQLSQRDSDTSAPDELQIGQQPDRKAIAPAQQSPWREIDTSAPDEVQIGKQEMQSDSGALEVATCFGSLCLVILAYRYCTTSAIWRLLVDLHAATANCLQLLDRAAIVAAQDFLRSSSRCWVILRTMIVISFASCAIGARNACSLTSCTLQASKQFFAAVSLCATGMREVLGLSCCSVRVSKRVFAALSNTCMLASSACLSLVMSCSIGLAMGTSLLLRKMCAAVQHSEMHSPKNMPANVVWKALHETKDLCRLPRHAACLDSDSAQQVTAPRCARMESVQARRLDAKPDAVQEPACEHSRILRTIQKNWIITRFSMAQRLAIDSWVFLRTFMEGIFRLARCVVRRTWSSLLAAPKVLVQGRQILSNPAASSPQVFGIATPPYESDEGAGEVQVLPPTKQMRKRRIGVGTQGAKGAASNMPLLMKVCGQALKRSFVSAAPLPVAFLEVARAAKRQRVR
jgi:hypothetical protein